MIDVDNRMSVYVALRSDNRFIKVGASFEPTERVGQLSRNQPEDFSWTLIRHRRVPGTGKGFLRPTRNAIRIEKAIAKKFYEYKVRGEYYQFSAINSVLAFLGKPFQFNELIEVECSNYKYKIYDIIL